MSMRSQVYEWSNLQANANQLRRTTSDAAVAVVANREYDIFTGGIGNNITKPAETTATQFIVIEDVASSPILGAAVQIRINTTDYFQNPDVTDMVGIPGLASPYPRGANSTLNVALATAGAVGSENILKSFDLYPDVYVLPGQVWDALVTFYNNSFAGTDAAANELMAFVKYTLYDGPDALIANKLLEMGISINPGNVDWYKRSLLQAQA